MLQSLNFGGLPLNLESSDIFIVSIKKFFQPLNHPIALLWTFCSLGFYLLMCKSSNHYSGSHSSVYRELKKIYINSFYSHSSPSGGSGRSDNRPRSQSHSLAAKDPWLQYSFLPSCLLLLLGIDLRVVPTGCPACTVREYISQLLLADVTRPVPLPRCISSFLDDFRGSLVCPNIQSILHWGQNNLPKILTWIMPLSYLWSFRSPQIPGHSLHWLLSAWLPLLPTPRHPHHHAASAAALGALHCPKCPEVLSVELLPTLLV